MTAWVITALVLICAVLLAGCVGLMFHVRDQREEIDVIARTLIKALDNRDVAMLLPQLSQLPQLWVNGSSAPRDYLGRLPAGHN